MLRNKANFAVLEGLPTVLLNDKTKIIKILGSASSDGIDDLREFGLS